MLIDEMHFRFNKGLDRVASQDRPDMLPNEIDDYLNRAILEFVKDRYGNLNQIKVGFETNQERISNLMSLHIKSPGPQMPLQATELRNGFYELTLNDLTYKYLFLTSAKLLITKNNCDKMIDYTAWQVDDNKNTFNEPSYEWGRVHANFGRSTVIGTSNDLSSIYFDTTDKKGVKQFDIKELYISYIKAPERVCLGTYKHIDDLSTLPLTPTAHCDIDDSFHDEVVNIAIQMAFADIQDSSGYQLYSQRVQTDK